MSFFVIDNDHENNKYSVVIVIFYNKINVKIIEVVKRFLSEQIKNSEQTE